MRLRPIAAAVVVVLAAGCSAVSTANVSRSAAPHATAATTTTVVTPPVEVDVEVASPAPEAPDVFVVGDSLTVGAEPWLAGAVRARGWRLTGVDARVGRTVTEGLAVLRRRAASLPGTVIVALGTNNLGASSADVDEWLASARRVVGPARRLVWVNVNLADTRRDDVINAALAASASRWRVDLLDWDGWARRQHLAHKADGIHYEDAVYRLRALFYAAALRPSATSRA